MSVVSRVITGLGALLLAAAVSAEDRTWDGGGADAFWNTPANWNGDLTAPAPGDRLIFGGAQRLVNSNDLAAATFAGITFANGAGAFTLEGGGVTLGGDLINLDADTQTLNLPLALDATRIFSATSGALVVNGAISGAGGLTKDGTKLLTLAASNAYEGVTTILTGRVAITHSAALGSAAQGTIVNPAAGLEIYNGLTLDEPITLVNYNPGSLFFMSGTNICRGLITITGGQARINNSSPDNAYITGGITSINSAVILNSAGGGASAIKISEKPIIALSQTCFSHGSSVTIFGVAGNEFATLENANGKLLLEVPNAWPAGLDLRVGVTYARNSHVDLQGNDQTVGKLSSPVTNDGVRVVTSSTGPGTLTVNQSAASEYNGNFAGQLRLLKLGSGTLSVTGTNCMQSAQTVIGGGKLGVIAEQNLGVAPDTFAADHLVISNGASLLALKPLGMDDANRGVSLGAGGGLFETSATADMWVSNRITGAGGLTKTGAGTLTLSGVNDYSGVTAVSAGTLQVGQKASLYNGSPLAADKFAVNSGAILSLCVGGAGEFMSGDVAAIAALGTSTEGLKPGSWLALSADNAPAGAYTVGDVLGNPSAGHGLNLLKLGAGTLELSGMNTYTGVTKISQGVLSVNSLTNGGIASALGMSGKRKENLIFGGGALRYTGPSTRTDRGFTYAVNTNVYGFEVMQAGTVLSFSSISNAQFDSSATVIKKTGPGTLAFGRSYPDGGHAAYAVRAIHLLEGRLTTDSAGNTVQMNVYTPATNGPSLLLGDGVELAFDTPLERYNDRLVQYVGTQTCARLTAAQLTLCGETNTPAAKNIHTFDVNDGSDEVDVLITSKLGIFPSTAVSDVVKAGRGTLRLTNATSAYRGATVIRSGRLLIGGSVANNVAGPLGQSTNVIQLGDALTQPADAPSLMFEGADNGALTCSRSIIVCPGGATGSLGCVSNINLTLSGAISVSNTLQLVSVATGTNAVFVTGGIGGPGGVTLSGTGAVMAVAANTYTGLTTLAAGALRLAASERFADESPLRLSGGKLETRGFSETMGALSVGGAAVIDFGAGASVLTFADSGGQTWSGTLTLRNWTQGADRLFVGSSACLSGAQLDAITSPSGQKAAQLSTGEVVLLPLGTRFSVR